MAETLSNWYPATMPPARTGWYEFGSGDRLHWDSHTNTWGTWFADKPGVRFTIAVEAGWRWRGLAEKA
jgi:hypothetical protein